jgi:hypothetical protein
MVLADFILIMDPFFKVALKKVWQIVTMDYLYILMDHSIKETYLIQGQKAMAFIIQRNYTIRENLKIINQKVWENRKLKINSIMLEHFIMDKKMDTENYNGLII